MQSICQFLDFCGCFSLTCISAMSCATYIMAKSGRTTCSHISAVILVPMTIVDVRDCRDRPLATSFAL